jgi:hypothetical protein
MNPHNSRLHPIILASSWRTALGDGWTAHFSRYVYRPQSVEDERKYINVPLEAVTEEWLDDQLARLSPGEEISIHSKLTKGRMIRHIPMIDFAIATGAHEQVISWAREHLHMKLHVFDSGRSFHAYGVRPVTTAEWIRLMGLLLLGNLPDKAPVVDSRWIGHRLLAGYSALRWSKNTAQYVGWPTLLEE